MTVEVPKTGEPNSPDQTTDYLYTSGNHREPSGILTDLAATFLHLLLQNHSPGTEIVCFQTIAANRMIGR